MIRKRNKLRHTITRVIRVMPHFQEKPITSSDTTLIQAVLIMLQASHVKTHSTITSTTVLADMKPKQVKNIKILLTVIHEADRRVLKTLLLKSDAKTKTAKLTVLCSQVGSFVSPRFQVHHHTWIVPREVQ